MTAFLWTVIIAIAAALVAEIVALVGLARVASRAARRTAEITNQVQQTLEPSVRIVKELRASLQPRVERIKDEGQEIGVLLSTRLLTIEAAWVDTSRRAERIRLRLTEGVETVEEHAQRRRGIYREVADPIQAAGKVLRGLKLALWLLRKVA